jgi:hypothetical protein
VTSPPAPAPAALPTSGVAPSPAELAQLEREVELYLTFWAYARDGRATPVEQAAR